MITIFPDYPDPESDPNTDGDPEPSESDLSED